MPAQRIHGLAALEALQVLRQLQRRPVTVLRPVCDGPREHCPQRTREAPRCCDLLVGDPLNRRRDRQAAQIARWATDDELEEHTPEAEDIARDVDLLWITGDVLGAHVLERAEDTACDRPNGRNPERP